MRYTGSSRENQSAVQPRIERSRRRFIRAMGVLAAAAVGVCASQTALAQCDTYTIAPGPATFIPGTSDIGNHSPAAVTTIALPFPVSVYGTQYTSAGVSTEGFVEFGATFTTQNNRCLPDNRFTVPVIMPFYDNLATVDGASGQGIFTSVTGSAGSRTFAIEWRASLIGSGAPSHIFEVLFHENQSYIDLVYQQLPAGNKAATVGIQGSASGPATEFECNPFFAGPSLVNSGVSLRLSVLPQPAPGACCFMGTCTFTCANLCYHDFSSGVACSPEPCPASAPPGKCWSYGISPGGATFIPGTTDIGDHSGGGTVTAVALPFPVTVYGATYTSANVATNGIVEFGSEIGLGEDAACLPSDVFRGPVIAAFWEDSLRLNQPGQGIFTSVTGSAGSRVFAIEWRAGSGSYSGDFNFEILFYEHQSFFDILYHAQPAGTQYQVIGVQASADGPAMTFRCLPSEYHVYGGFSLRFSCDAWSGGACCISGVCSVVGSAPECSGGIFSAGALCTPGVCIPGNDSCAGAFNLGALMYPTFDRWNDVLTYNVSAGEDQTDCTTLYNAFWFTYTATEASLLTFDGDADTGWAKAVDCGAMPECLFIADGNDGHIQLGAGETVKLVYGGLFPTTDASSLIRAGFRVDPLTTPANDHCENAIDMAAMPGTFCDMVIYNANATDDSGSCPGLHHGVWFTLTATQPTVWRYECNPGTVLATAPDCSTPPQCLPDRIGQLVLMPGQTVKLLAGNDSPDVDLLNARQFRFDVNPAFACCNYGTCTVQGGGCSEGTAIAGVTCTPDPCPGPPPGQCWEYTISSATTPYTTATNDTGLHTDEGSTDVALPFPVTLFGAPVNTFKVNVNGYIVLDFNRQWFEPEGCLPDNRFFAPTIFALFTDFITEDADSGRGVFTEVTGSPGSRKFIVEWRASRWIDDTSDPVFRFEAVFYENQSHFDLLYQAVPAGDMWATIGAQPARTGPVTQYLCPPDTGTRPTSGMGLRFGCAPHCVADFNGNGSVSVQDIFDFLAAWFGGC